MSFGKQLPPKPGPGCKNFGPILLSNPIPLATICTFPPVFSQRFAISFINETFRARKALEAYFIISALSISVKRTGASLRFKGLYNSFKVSSAFLSVTPQTTLSGLIKSSIADPSLKNSGLDDTK